MNIRTNASTVSFLWILSIITTLTPFPANGDPLLQEPPKIIESAWKEAQEAWHHVRQLQAKDTPLLKKKRADLSHATQKRELAEKKRDTVWWQNNSDLQEINQTHDLAQQTFLKQQSTHKLLKTTQKNSQQAIQQAIWQAERLESIALTTWQTWVDTYGSAILSEANRQEYAAQLLVRYYEEQINHSFIQAKKQRVLAEHSLVLVKQIQALANQTINQAITQAKKAKQRATMAQSHIGRSWTEEGGLDSMVQEEENIRLALLEAKTMEKNIPLIKKQYQKRIRQAQNSAQIQAQKAQTDLNKLKTLQDQMRMATDKALKQATYARNLAEKVRTPKWYKTPKTTQLN